MKWVQESLCPYDVKKAESSDLLRKEFLLFVSEGLVSQTENSAPQPIQILRDTGASQSLLLKEALPSCECEDTEKGDFTLVQGIVGRSVTVPLHFVYLKSELVTGQVKVGLCPVSLLKAFLSCLATILQEAKLSPLFS